MLRSAALCLAASVFAACSAEPGRSLPPDQSGSSTPSPAAAVQSEPPAKAVAGTAGCAAVDLATDEADRIYLAASCPAAPATASAAAAPPAVPGSPAAAPASPMGVSDAALASGKVTALDDLMLVRTAPSAHLAAGAAGHLYVIEDVGALQLGVLLTTNGGGSWSSLASPDRSSHFIQGAAVATGARVLFGALDFGPGPDIRLPFPIRLWRTPARAQGPIPSTSLAGVTAGDSVSLASEPATFGLYLEPGSSRVWVAQARPGNQISIASSSDDAITFARPQVVGVRGQPARYAFGNGRVYVLDRGGVTVIGLAPTISPLSSLAWPGPVDVIRAAVVDRAGNLTAFTTGADGTLSVFRLASGAGALTERQLGPAEGAVVAAAQSDGRIAYVTSRGGGLSLAKLPPL